MFSGCGTTAKQFVREIPVSQKNIIRNKTAIILPFADYSDDDDIELAYRRNIFLNESITDHFTALGFNVPVQEDVILYLTQKNIIQITPSCASKAKTLENELQKEWSGEMKEILRDNINYTKDSLGNGAPSVVTNGLTDQEIIKIGRHFSGDYIVRGRIIQYNLRSNSDLYPWKKGILPFFGAAFTPFIFGQATKDKYDRTDGFDDFSIPEAVVQVRIWIQDAYTGSVVWTNGKNVKITPKSFWADYQQDALFESATENAIASLMNDFSQTFLVANR